jgi:HAD superfamily hydrolase (TIGR01458 family)
MTGQIASPRHAVDHRDVRAVGAELDVVASPMHVGAVELFLFDIDGVFLAGKDAPRLVSGQRILPALRERGLPYRLVTNTSTHPSTAVAESLRGHGLDVRAEEIISALDATVAAAAERHRGARCLVVGERGLAEAAAAAGLQVVDRRPAEVVVLGLAREVDYRSLSRAARCLLDGAQLIGCHRNKLWLDEDEKALSCGPWLAALEYATGVKAEVFGKPSPDFFARARGAAGVSPDRCLMVGDDLEVDVGGAQRAGMRGALVLTGKTSRDGLERHRIRPDLVLQEVDDLVELLG